MRVLIGCEESGNGRRAFRSRGHDAWSCDLIPARDGSPHHLQKDIFDAILDDGPWDIIILHPDCTAMACSGNRWYGRGCRDHQKRIEAVVWTVLLWRVAKKMARVGCVIENPKSVLWTALGVVPQYVQPHDYGHGETKETGLLADRLPRLVPTNPVEGREHRIWKMAPGPNRKRDRSETFPGIADAMAEQWGTAIPPMCGFGG